MSIDSDPGRSPTGAPPSPPLTSADAAGASELRMLREQLEMATTTARLTWWQWDGRTDEVRRYSGHPCFDDLAPEPESRASDWLACVHPDDVPSLRAGLEQLRGGGADQVNQELRLRRRNGEFRWVLACARVTERAEDGSPRSLRGTAQDIHDRKQAEETVRRDAEVLSKFRESIVCTDLDGIVTYWNDGATQLYAWTAEEMLGDLLWRRFPDEARTAVLKVHEQVRGGVDASFDWRDTRKDGSHFWVEVHLSRFNDAAGKPAGVIGISYDVTARRTAEETIRRDAQVLAQLQDAVVCMDEHLNVLYWNGAAEKIFQWTREEMVGNSILQRLPEYIRAEVGKIMDPVLLGAAVSTSEWQDFRKDGSRVWIYWRSQPLTNADGVVVGSVNVGTDVTDRKEAEAKRIELERRLFHAQKMETMGTLAGGIAHDFNNILATILIQSELGRGHPGVHAKVEGSFNEIRRASLRAKELVRRILTFSRHHEPARRKLDVSDLVRDVTVFLRPTLPATIEMNSELPTLPVEVVADPNDLEQLLMNLSSNAAHAMPDGGSLHFEVSELVLSEPRSVTTGTLVAGRYATIAVRDNGVGMTPEVILRMFDPFFTTKPTGQGTGLGLSIVSGIVQNHRGGLDVESALGRGSCLTVYLPAVQTYGVSSPVSAAPKSAPIGRGERILVVDDEESVAILTRLALEKLGYYVRHMTSVQELLHEFEQAPANCDLVLTDQTMPHTTGFELAVRLRAAGHQHPIIVATGNPRRVELTQLTALGNARLLEKPFEIEQLARLVRTLLDGQEPS